MRIQLGFPSQFFFWKCRLCGWLQILKTEIFGSVAIVGSLAEKSLYEYGPRQSGDNMLIKRYEGLMELIDGKFDFRKLGLCVGAPYE